MADSGGLLARSGLDSLKIGGHKVPIALIAGGIALIGVIAVVRARQSGQNVLSAGQAPATAAGSGFGLPLPSSDVGPALANLSQQLNQLGQQGINSPAAAPQHMVTGGLGDTAVWLHAAPSASSPVAALLRPGESAAVAGSPVTGESFTNAQLGISGNQWEPINVGGTTYWAFLPEVKVS